MEYNCRRCDNLWPYRRVRTALVTTIYRKSLRLSPSGRQARTTGEVVNLMSTDSQRMQAHLVIN